MMQFPAQETALKSQGDVQDVTIELIAMAFDVILQGYIRLEHRSPGRFPFQPGRLASIQQQKVELVQYYFTLVQTRKLDQLSAFRLMRYDIREKLSV